MRDFNPDWLYSCTCGDRTAFGVVHMKDEPCYRPEELDGATGEKHMNAGVLAQARRLYLHALNGGTLTPEDVSFMVVALEKAYDGEKHTKQYKLAKVKFNNGYGALLCNECSTIIAEGWEHEDRTHLCEKCKESNDEDNRTNR